MQGLWNFSDISVSVVSHLLTESFSKMLNEIWIGKACEIMNNRSELFIKDIAVMVGYSDQFYFSRIFRFCQGSRPFRIYGEVVRCVSASDSFFYLIGNFVFYKVKNLREIAVRRKGIMLLIRSAEDSFSKVKKRVEKGRDVGYNGFKW